MNAARHAKTTRSGVVKRTNPQSMRARAERCRGMVWPPSSDNVARWSSRLASRSCKVMCVPRAAASSRANGSPSRRRTISTTIGTDASGSAKSSSNERARSTNMANAGEASASAAGASPACSGTANVANRITVSPGTRNGSRLVASTVNVGCASKSSRTDPAAASIKCSQPSNTSRCASPSSADSMRMRLTASRSVVPSVKTDVSRNAKCE